MFELLVLVLFLVVVGADFATTAELSFSVFYLIPIVMLTRRRGARWGTALALASAGACLAMDLADPRPGHAVFHYWDAAVRLIFYLVVVVMVTRLRSAQAREVAGDLARAQLLLRVETTAKLEAQLALRHADRLSTVGKLAAGVAHELGTPLNVVDGRAKMIRSGEVVGPELHDSARIISEQVTAMSRIIRQLLDFARRKQPKKVHEQIAPLVCRTLELLKPMAAKKNIRLVCQVSPQITVLVDGPAIQQVLANLVMNAIQAMTAAGEVRIRAIDARRKRPDEEHAEEQAWLRVEVEDEGPGIPEEARRHVFEPFFTTKPLGEGTGLGLSVSYGIVQDHGGWIEIDPEYAAGSRFSVFLPKEQSA